MDSRRKRLAAPWQIRLLVVALGVSASVRAHAEAPDESAAAAAMPGVVNGVFMMAPIRGPGDLPAPEAVTPAPPAQQASPASPSPAPQAAVPVPKPAAELRTAATPPPSPTPAQEKLIDQAFAQMKQANWTKARELAAQSANSVAQTIVEWRFLLDDPGMNFDAIDAFLAAHPDWPRRDGLIIRAERDMPAPLSPKQVIQWYSDRTPSTGIGMVRLGEALLATGKTKEGRALIRRAWIEDELSNADEKDLLRKHADLLDARTEKERLDHILAHDDLAGARRQMRRLDKDMQRLVEARLRLKTTRTPVWRISESVPESLRKDPELLFEEAQTLRRRGEDDDAWKYMLEAPTDPAKLTIPDHWWNERHIMARDALTAGKYDIAYRLAVGAVTTNAGDTADAQFLAGWIALRFLHKPDTALKHFQKLADAVSLPVSVARGYYWIGRAEESLNRPADAIAAYRRAAENAATFYGQLALARIDDAPTLHLASTEVRFEPAAALRFDADSRIQAIRLLSQAGERDLARLFAIRVANDLSNSVDLQRLAQLMLDLGDPAMSVRVAKLASYSNVLLASYLAPVMDLPHYPGGSAPEAPLVLGLARQESEFDPSVVSSAGARGLMQLMPATAQAAAKSLGLHYRLQDLTARPDYNMQLGMAGIADYLDRWGGSYILAIASYNAGAANVKNWIATNGDPRDPNVDPIDWIEMIPFGETRNYVQRVLENVEVYRSRLSGGDHRLAILTDLYRPSAPQLAVVKPPAPPVARPALPTAALTVPLDLTVPLAQPLADPDDE
jgi:peptidoglycan lytic transglycosylase